jgi:hypothetical protein
MPALDDPRVLVVVADGVPNWAALDAVLLVAKRAPVPKLAAELALNRAKPVLAAELAPNRAVPVLAAELVPNEKLGPELGPELVPSRAEPVLAAELVPNENAELVPNILVPKLAAALALAKPVLAAELVPNGAVPVLAAELAPPCTLRNTNSTSDAQ